MGTRGPTPKRSSERAGHRAKSDTPDQVIAGTRVRALPADKAWHPQAARWYRSLGRSGQARFFEPSDWSEAHLLADLLTRELTQTRVVRTRNGPEVVPVAPRALMIKTILGAMNELGTTESARRRMRIEVDRRRNGSGEVHDPKVAVLDDFRDAFG